MGALLAKFPKTRGGKSVLGKDIASDGEDLSRFLHTTKYRARPGPVHTKKCHKEHSQSIVIPIGYSVKNRPRCP
jgi:hypothetical protein